MPFCCQGSENGLTIDGGTTLGHELADQLSIAGLAAARLFVQVGGGALASATVRGLQDGVALGVLGGMPAVHLVQTEGAAPLRRAWEIVARRALTSLGRPDAMSDGDAAVAATLRAPDAAEAVSEAMRWAVTHRSKVMWPWEDEPVSIATGILDDETYDWHAALDAMLSTVAGPSSSTSARWRTPTPPRGRGPTRPAPPGWPARCGWHAAASSRPTSPSWRW